MPNITHLLGGPLDGETLFYCPLPMPQTLFLVATLDQDGDFATRTVAKSICSEHREIYLIYQYCGKEQHRFVGHKLPDIEAII